MAQRSSRHAVAPVSPQRCALGVDIVKTDTHTDFNSDFDEDAGWPVRPMS
jgi:hypothetical protein